MSTFIFWIKKGEIEDKKLQEIGIFHLLIFKLAMVSIKGNIQDRLEILSDSQIRINTLNFWDKSSSDGGESIFLTAAKNSSNSISPDPEICRNRC